MVSCIFIVYELYKTIMECCTTKTNTKINTNLHTHVYKYSRYLVIQISIMVCKYIYIIHTY